jgi:hypothetical protein
VNRQRVETRWCPVHDSQIKRGTRRCRSCVADLSLPTRRRLGVPAARLRPMRKKGEPTQRANERREKGYVS